MYKGTIHAGDSERDESEGNELDGPGFRHFRWIEWLGNNAKGSLKQLTFDVKVDCWRFRIWLEMSDRATVPFSACSPNRALRSGAISTPPSSRCLSSVSKK